MRRKRDKDIDIDNEYLVGSGRPAMNPAEAARVLGIHPDTLRKRLEIGYYPNIRTDLVKQGRKFDMVDVFRAAYPTASGNMIAFLMKEYRERSMETRRRRTLKSFDVSDLVNELRKISEAGGGNVIVYRRTGIREDPSLAAEITLARSLEGRIKFEGALLTDRCFLFQYSQNPILKALRNSIV